MKPELVLNSAVNKIIQPINHIPPYILAVPDVNPVLIKSIP
jgi:hypothetical protein